MESRKNTRTLTFRTANIINDGGADPIVCAVLNLSETGVCLLVADVDAVPDDFSLQVDHDGWRRRCGVVWRQQHRLGVRFYDHDTATSHAALVNAHPNRD